MEYKYAVTRKYAHATDGVVHDGIVFGIGPDGTMYVDGRPIPDNSAEYLLEFAGQCLQDAYAGKDLGIDERKSRFMDKFAKILNGTIRTYGAGVTDFQRELRSAFYAYVRADKEYADLYADLKDMDAKERGEALDTLLADLEEADHDWFTEKAEEAIERKRLEAANRTARKVKIGGIKPKA